MEVNGSQRKSVEVDVEVEAEEEMEVNGSLCRISLKSAEVGTEVHGNQWKSVVVRGSRGKSMEASGSGWELVEVGGSL